MYVIIIIIIYLLNGICYASSFWNQRRDGSRLQLFSQTPSLEALRREWETLSHYYYLD